MGVGGKLLAGVSILTATAIVVAVKGLTFTSALIELILFAVAIISWAVVRQAGDSSTAVIKGVRAGGNVRIWQRAKVTRLGCASAGRDIEISQDDG